MCSIHKAKAHWKAEAFFFILQGAAAGRRGAPVSAFYLGPVEPGLP